MERRTRREKGSASLRKSSIALAPRGCRLLTAALARLFGTTVF